MRTSAYTRIYSRDFTEHQKVSYWNLFVLKLLHVKSKPDKILSFQSLIKHAILRAILRITQYCTQNLFLSNVT